MFALFKRNPVREAADLAYARIVAQSRQPRFFSACGVPDTLDGRFELICLHAFLYLHRLQGEAYAAASLGQRFCEAMFTDFDRSLREIGVGDLSVGREIKRMAAAFYGRIAAYDRALAEDGVGLEAALARNLFGTVSPAPAQLAAMAHYVRDEAIRLDRQPLVELRAGRPVFGAPPAVGAPVAVERE